MLFGEGWKSQYTVFVETPVAPNVTVNTPVRKNGIRIGRVAEVENRDRSVRLTLKINSNEAIYENEVCEIGTASFLGDAVIDFMPGTDPNRGEALTDRQSVQARNVAIERNPVELIDVALNLENQVDTTLRSIQLASDNVALAAEKADQIMGAMQDAVGGQDSGFREFLENSRKLSAKAEIAIENFNEFMVNINEVAGDPEMRANFRESVAKLPELLDEVNVTVSDARETINSFRDVSANAGENLANLTDFTQALGEQGPEIIDSLNKSLAKLDSLITDVGEFAGGGDSQGTLGKLLNDPELYDNLNETIRNARDISAQLKPLIIQLQPLMNDVRYAVDGIARDPGQLGVRGALDRSQPFGKYKGTVVPVPGYQ
jgi:phospholipid/cholesterol/gamma-HCH transport system substrate-binding protein